MLQLFQLENFFEINQRYREKDFLVRNQGIDFGCLKGLIFHEKPKLDKALKQEKMPVLTEVIRYANKPCDDPMWKTIVFSNMLISHAPIFSTNKKSDSVQRYVNEPCACVFIDNKHF